MQIHLEIHHNYSDIKFSKLSKSFFLKTPLNNTFQAACSGVRKGTAKISKWIVTTPCGSKLSINIWVTKSKGSIRKAIISSVGKNNNVFVTNKQKASMQIFCSDLDIVRPTGGFLNLLQHFTAVHCMFSSNGSGRS